MKIKILIALALAVSLGACSSPEERAADYVVEGDKLYQEGDFEKAFLQYKNALQLNNNLDNAWYGVAKINIYRQEWRKAYEVLNKIYELNPLNYEARLDLAEMLFASNQLEKGIEHVGEIVEQFPDRSGTFTLQSVMYYRLGNFDEALKYVNLALQKDPSNQKVLMTQSKVYADQEDWDKALSVIDSALQKSDKKAPFFLLKQFILQQKGASNSEFIALLRDLIEEYPGKNEYNFSLANYLAQDGHKEEAEALLKNLASSSSQNIENKLAYVDFMREFYGFDKAKAILDAYNTATPSSDYDFYLASYYKKEEQLDEAIAVYEGVISQYAGQVDALSAKNEMAVLLYNNEQIEAAKQTIAEVLAVAPNNTEALMLDAQVKLLEDNADDAIVKLRNLLREEPDNTEAMYFLSEAYKAIGSEELSLDNLINAYRLKPRELKYAYALATYHYDNKEFERAIEILEAQMNARPTMAVVRLLSQAYLDVQNWEKAQQMVSVLDQFEGQEALSHHLAAMILEGKKDYSSSTDAYQEAHKLSPTAVQPIVGLVRVYIRNGEVEKAKTFLKTILNVDQKNLTAYLLLIDIARSENNQSEFDRYLTAMIEFNPEVESVYRVAALNFISRNETDKALAFLDQGIKDAKTTAALRMTKAGLYERMARFDDAKQVYEEIIAANENYAVAKNNLANLLLDRYDDANSHQMALNLVNDFKRSRIEYFLDTYAWALVKNKQNLQEAISVLFRLVEGENPLSVYKYHLVVGLMEGNQLFRAETMANDLKEEFDNSFADEKVVDELLKEIKSRQQQVAS